MEARYSIGHASQITGLSTHTLRVWERRYGFPVPSRTQGGARRYSDDDVSRLKLIVRALDSGYRAGDVVKQSARELATLLADDPHVAAPAGGAPAIDEVVSAILADDVTAVRDHLRRAVATFGPKRFLTDMAEPLMVRVGDLWEQGELSVQHEHLSSELMSTQLRVLHSAYESLDGRPRVLLATLPDELHGLALEMVALYLSTQGASTRLLGRSTPVDEIVNAATKLQVDVVGVSMSSACDTRRTTRSLRALLDALPRRVDLWVGGAGASKPAIAKLPARVVVSWEELDEAVAAWRQRR